MDLPIHDTDPDVGNGVSPGLGEGWIGILDCGRLATLVSIPLSLSISGSFVKTMVEIKTLVLSRTG